MLGDWRITEMGGLGSWRFKGIGLTFKKHKYWDHIKKQSTSLVDSLIKELSLTKEEERFLKDRCARRSIHREEGN